MNTRGPLLCMRAWGRVLRAEGSPGSFVAVSSVSARLVDRSMGVYCASKAALSCWSRWRPRSGAPTACASTRWARASRHAHAHGPARLHGSHPWLDGVVNRTSLGRLGEADDIARRSWACTPWSGSPAR